MIARAVNVVMPPEVQDRIAELGLTEEIDRVVDYTRATIPTLSEIRFSLFDSPLEPHGKRIRIEAIKEGPHTRRDLERRTLKRTVIHASSIPFRRWTRFDMCTREELDGR